MWWEAEATEWRVVGRRGRRGASNWKNVLFEGRVTSDNAPPIGEELAKSLRAIYTDLFTGYGVIIRSKLPPRFSFLSPARLLKKWTKSRLSFCKQWKIHLVKAPRALTLSERSAKRPQLHGLQTSRSVSGLATTFHEWPIRNTTHTFGKRSLEFSLQYHSCPKPESLTSYTIYTHDKKKKNSNSPFCQNRTSHWIEIWDTNSLFRLL